MNTTLSKTQIRIITELMIHAASGRKVDLSKESEQDVSIAREAFVERLSAILEPPALRIQYEENYANSDEEKLSIAFPRAIEALKSGRAGTIVAGKYFIDAFHSAINIGLYEEAIVATFGMAMANVTPAPYVKIVKSCFPEGNTWFNEYMQELVLNRTKEFNLPEFLSWYKS